MNKSHKKNVDIEPQKKKKKVGTKSPKGKSSKRKTSHKKKHVLTKKKSKKKSLRSKKNKRSKKRKSKTGVLSKIGIAALISLIVYVSIFMIFFTVGRVNGYAMISTLNDKDIVAISKRKKVNRFDLVYMKTPKSKQEKSVRRVIGVPGDEVTFKNDDLYINGEMKEEKYLSSKKKMMKDMILTDDFLLKDITGETRVPPDKYLVLGDNRKSATDSRYYGLVSNNDVIGVVKYRLFPFSKFKVF